MARCFRGSLLPLTSFDFALGNFGTFKPWQKTLRSQAPALMLPIGTKALVVVPYCVAGNAGRPPDSIARLVQHDPWLLHNG